MELQGKKRKAYILFAVGGFVVAVGIVIGVIALGVIARTWGEVPHMQAAGLCVVAPDPTYSMEGSADGDVHLLAVTSDEKATGLFVQASANLPLDTGIIETARAHPGIFRSTVNEPDQLFAAEPLPGKRLYHLTFRGTDEAERFRIMAGVSFCPEEVAPLPS